MSDLLKRLRRVDSAPGWQTPKAGVEHITSNWYVNPDGPEAADEIERLQAERDRAVLTAMERNTEIHKLQAVVDAAQKDVRRCHRLLEEAYGCIDPEQWPTIVGSIAQELSQCDCALDGEVKP